MPEPTNAELVEQKRCPDCGIAKPLTAFNRNRARRDGYQHNCRECQNERRAEDERRNPRAPHRGKRRTLEAIAGEKVRRAVRDGTLIKPDACEQCGRQGKGITLQGHHADYAKPLEVVWLCPTCHACRHEERTDALDALIAKAQAAEAAEAERNELRDLWLAQTKRADCFLVEIANLKDRLTMFSAAYKLTGDAEIERLTTEVAQFKGALRTAESVASSGVGPGTTPEQALSTLALFLAKRLAALAPQPPYDDVPGAGQPTCG